MNPIFRVPTCNEYINVTTTGYTGNWGDGYLSGGKANVSGWPGGTNAFSNRAVRGGGYGSLTAQLAVADRRDRSYSSGGATYRYGPNASWSYRYGDMGGRGVR